MSVAIRRQIISGQKQVVIEISHVESLDPGYSSTTPLSSDPEIAVAEADELEDEQN